MTTNVELSFVRTSPGCDVLRDAPLPEHLRNKHYVAKYDFTTLFYDIYRCGSYTVFQGPPLFNFKKYIGNTEFHADIVKSGGFLIDRKYGSEFWVKKHYEDISIESEIFSAEVVVQPDLSDIYEGKRVLYTLSKDNDLLWIKDWIKFHVRNHGADAVLIYDNASSVYSGAELEDAIVKDFPGLTTRVVNWPFKFGPKIWRRRNADGREERINSKFCQAGALQHARFRFLQKARSVLSCDIDELVYSTRGNRSIFEAAERSLFGSLHFKGRWIEGGKSTGLLPRHADFTRYLKEDRVGSPPKWAVVPARCARSTTWTAHRVKGLLHSFTDSGRFGFGHFKDITTNWRGGIRSSQAGRGDSSDYQVDEMLVSAMRSAGLQPSD
jgi:hypothetical protein